MNEVNCMQFFCGRPESEDTSQISSSKNHSLAFLYPAYFINIYSYKILDKLFCDHLNNKLYLLKLISVD